jgi:catechol 2,3-dioxygenase-like lactoylglutathione lyase family enzyme
VIRSISVLKASAARQGRRTDIMHLARSTALLFGFLFWTSEADARVIQIERMVITVSDLDQTEAFYRDGLGFTTTTRQSSDQAATERLLGISGPMDSLTMELGRERVEFIHYSKSGRQYPVDSRSPDLWFQHLAIVVADMDVAYARLQKVSFKPISEDGPRTLPEEDGRVRAFKFRDPDGHPLELVYFPAGQGRKIWAVHDKDRIELGVDHTAISVSQTPASLAFYAKLLGMTAAYKVTNTGVAQDQLDGIRNAKVRITGLRPASQDGPGIELLDYRSLPRGRPSSLDSRPDDLWHAHIVLRVDALDEMTAALHRHKVRFVSSGIVRLGNGKRAVEITDPDGHSLVLEE